MTKTTTTSQAERAASRRRAKSGGPALPDRDPVNCLLEAADGATAVAIDRLGEERLVVRSPSGRVLFEYHADGSQRCVVYAPERDLEIRAEGKVAIKGAAIDLEGDRLDVRAGVVEVAADRWIERMRNVYREVEELSQTHAARIRSIAKETMQILGRRTIVKAEEDMKVKGERIHLG
jgi:hypothetical protein